MRIYLIFSAPLQYVISSYFRLVSIFLGSLVISIAEKDEIYYTIIYSCIVGFFFCWPLWIFWFLLKNYESLEDKKFAERFRSLYNGIKLSSTAALAYKAIFAVRRFDIILDNLIFTKESPILDL